MAATAQHHHAQYRLRPRWTDLRISGGKDRDLDEWYPHQRHRWLGAFLLVANGYEAFKSGCSKSQRRHRVQSQLPSRTAD